MLRSLSFGVIVVLASIVARPVLARSTQEYAYSYDQLWRASVRLVAVDFRFPITERDPEIGYLLFQYQDQGRTYDGSLELVRAQDRDGADRVRVVVQINALPSYVERMMLDRLRRKLTDEHGAPRPSRPAPPAPSPPAGDDDDDDDDAPPEEPPAS